MATSLAISQRVLLGVAVAFFGYLGFRRGINRELLQLIGIAIGMWVASQMAPATQGLVNRFYKLFRLMLSGGLLSDNPAQAWQNVQSLPNLVRTPADVQMLTVLTFIGIVLLFYVVGQHQLSEPASLAVRVMGAIAGIVNGFLIAYYLFPIFFSGQEAVIRLPSGEVQQTLTDEQTIARMLALFIFLLIAFGLYTASAPKQRR